MQLGTPPVPMGTLQRAARWVWARLRPTVPTADPSDRWKDNDVRDLVQVLGNTSTRELRLLLLIADGPRPAVPGSELGSKFGCGTPLDLARDLPELHKYCTSRKLPPPLVAGGTTGDDDTAYTLVWAAAYRRLFVESFDASDGS